MLLREPLRAWRTRIFRKSVGDQAFGQVGGRCLLALPAIARGPQTSIGNPVLRDWMPADGKANVTCPLEVARGERDLTGAASVRPVANLSCRRRFRHMRVRSAGLQCRPAVP